MGQINREAIVKVVLVSPFHQCTHRRRSNLHSTHVWNMILCNNRKAAIFFRANSFAYQLELSFTFEMVNKSRDLFGRSEKSISRR